MMRSVFLAIIVLLLNGCGLPNPLLGGYPTYSLYEANVSLTHRDLFGMKHGRNYRLSEDHTFYNNGKKVGLLSAGDVVRPFSSKRWNTVTQGYRYHLEARVKSGELQGKRVEIYEEDARLFLPEESARGAD